MDPTTTLTMAIGKRRYTVASLADASAKFCAARDKAGTGASRTPTPFLFDGAGNQVGHISYNGRVWAGDPRDWQPNTKPLFDNALSKTGG